MSKRLQDHILSLEVQPVVTVTATTDDSSLETAIMGRIVRRANIKRLLDNNAEAGSGDRSTTDTALAIRMMKIGVPPHYIKGVLFHRRNSKAATKANPESYMDSILGSATKALANEPPPGQDDFLIIKKRADGKVSSIQPDTMGIARWLRNEFEFKTLKDSEEVFVYVVEKGIYEEAKTFIGAWTQKLAGDFTSNRTVAEVIGKIKRSTFISREDFDKGAKGVAVENGVLFPEERRLEPFNPYNFHLSKSPVMFDPEASSKLWNKCMLEWVNENDALFLQEWVGLHFLREYRFKISPILYGDGDNGKTVFLETIEALLGAHNVSHETLQKLVRSNFAAVRLYRKMANVVADLPGTTIRDPGTWKALTGQDTISGEIKNVQNTINFRNYALMTFAANDPPAFAEDTSAVYNRLPVVNFIGVFSGENRDARLGEKLRKPEELSGILNWALDGLARMMKRQEFSKDINDTTLLRKNYLRLADTAKLFVEEEIEFDPSDYIPYRELYKLYVEWCKSEGIMPDPSNRFKKSLQTAIPNITGRQRTIKGDSRPWCWLGLYVKGHHGEWMTEGDLLQQKIDG